MFFILIIVAAIVLLHNVTGAGLNAKKIKLDCYSEYCTIIGKTKDLLGNTKKGEV